MPLVQLLVFLLGFAIVIGTLLSAVRTFVVPRSQQDPLTRIVFVTVRLFFTLANKTARTYTDRDRILAFYAPIALLMLVPVWLTLITFGYSCMFWATGAPSGYDAFRDSGSALLTLGFAPVEGFIPTLMSFTEAMIGLLLIALLIAYLPSIYSAFQRRELAVTLLEVRAGSPPSAVEMIERFHRIHGLTRLAEMWQNPKPTDPISITREEYDATYDRLAGKGVPVKPDRDQAWRDFAGWRVNYDTVLLALCEFTNAPPAPWSSDRSKGRARELRHAHRNPTR